MPEGGINQESTSAGQRELSPQVIEVQKAFEARTNTMVNGEKSIVEGSISFNEGVTSAFENFSQAVSKYTPDGWVLIEDFKGVERQTMPGGETYLNLPPFKRYFIPQTTETYTVYREDIEMGYALGGKIQTLESLRQNNPQGFAKVKRINRADYDELKIDYLVPTWNGITNEIDLVAKIEKALSLPYESDPDLKSAKERFDKAVKDLGAYGNESEDSFRKKVKQCQLSIVDIFAYSFKLPDIIKVLEVNAKTRYMAEHFQNKNPDDLVPVFLLPKDRRLVNGQLNKDGFLGFGKQRIEGAQDVDDKTWFDLRYDMDKALISAVPGLQEKLGPI